MYMKQQYKDQWIFPDMASKRIAAVMIDLSGTVHVGQNLLPGAKEAVDLLRENRVILKSSR